MFSVAAYTQTNTLPPTGNGGIGTTTATTALQVNGTPRIYSSLVGKDSVTVKRNLIVELVVRFLGATKLNQAKVNGKFGTNFLVFF